MSDTNGHPTRARPLGAVEAGVLAACAEAGERRHELLPHLAAAIGVPPADVFYTWAMRRCPQRGRLLGTEWTYFFHGLDCDLEHTGDGRRLRFDFGPGGRVDTFTSWSVLQFIRTSVAPWPDYPDLKAHLLGTDPASGRVTGDTRAMAAVWQRLETLGAFEPADPDLIAFRARNTTIGTDGLRHVRFPEGTLETTALDTSVAHRQVLTPVGLRLLEEYTADHEELAAR